MHFAPLHFALFIQRTIASFAKKHNKKRKKAAIVQSFAGFGVEVAKRISGVIQAIDDFY